VLQEKEFERVGESRTIRVDTRVVAATNQFLTDEIEAGRFRDGPYYRLKHLPIYLPPLRERARGHHVLASYFLRARPRSTASIRPEMTAEMITSSKATTGRATSRAGDYMERAVVLASGRPDARPPRRPDGANAAGAPEPRGGTSTA